MSNFTMQVGSVEIIALTDMSFPFPMPLNELWPQVSPDAWEPYRERYPDTFHNNQMLIEIGCYLLRCQGRSILIDTGYGPGPIESIGGLEGQLMLNLTRENIDPKEVDIVFLSHLHSDHVGWNTVEEGGKSCSRLSQRKVHCPPGGFGTLPKAQRTGCFLLSIYGSERRATGDPGPP